MKWPLLIAAIPAAWSLQDPVSSTDFKISANVDLVMIDVGVKDSTNRFVTGLTQHDFRVFDNGRLQSIHYFGKSDSPVTLGLVIDNSGSMIPKRAIVDQSAVALIRASNPDDQAFTVQFNDTVKFGLAPGTAFTASVPELIQALARGASAGRTAFNDGIAAALAHVKDGSNGRKALVLVSDGGDNASSTTWPQVRALVESSPASIYTIGIFNDDDEDRNPNILHQLADMSGGEYFRADDLNSLGGICQTIASDIRNTYTLAFTPSEASGNPLHRLKVAVSSPAGGHLSVRARNSYLSNSTPTTSAGKHP